MLDARASLVIRVEMDPSWVVKSKLDNRNDIYNFGKSGFSVIVRNRNKGSKLQR